MINRFARKHNVKKDRILYVGDELRDIEACKRAGVTVVWVDWGLDLPETVRGANPEYMVSKPEEIYKIINNRGEEK